MRVIKATWLATFVMAVSILCPGLLLHLIEPRRLWVLVIAILVATPSIWWWLVARRQVAGLGRGAAAGAISAGIIFLIPLVWFVGRVAHVGTGRDASLTTLAFFMILAGIWSLAVMIGAASGLVTALLQRRWVAARPT